MKGITNRLLPLVMVVLCSMCAAAQITETGEPQQLPGKLTLHTLSVSGKSNEQPIATLYFYRSYMSKIFAPLKKMSIYVNDSLIYELKANSVVSYPVYRAGKYNVSGDSKDKTLMTVTVKPGNDYFFNCWLPTSLLDPPMTVESVHPDLARKELGLPAKPMVAETATAPQAAAVPIDTAKGKDSVTATVTKAQFPGGLSVWAQFLQNNINTKLGRKYIPLPKNESSATQVAMVDFVIDANGNVTDVKVTNANDVHPKLVEEAIRVISKSPKWIPATMNGKNVTYHAKQPINFEVDRG